MKQLRAIILAAGKGTRMYSDIPKVLHQVCGKALIQTVVDTVSAVGSLKTYVVLGHKIEVVREQLSKELVIVHQKKLAGTADAVKSAAAHFRSYRGDVLILCGDTPLLTKETIKQLIRKHQSSQAVCTVLTAVIASPQGYGRMIRDSRGQVTAIREDKDASDEERAVNEINVGVYCFKSKELFAALKRVKVNPKKKEFYLTDTIDLFYQQGLKVETYVTDDPSEGLGVNTRVDLAVAHNIIRQKILKKFMLDGVTIVDPATTYIDAGVKIGRDTIIRPYTFIEHDVNIGSRCLIGPFAHIRPKSVIGDDVEVGNFTEVNRSKLGNKTLMKHFSYLGDATVGAHVNIGAGTVTANFDGKNKHDSKILDYAFIGSDAVLVAPVKIGKKAVVGAGSVVTRGKIIPDGGVAVGVPARVIRKENIS
jgi:bifunctional UDP-N-acetylglucosamine pyrophosphorylase/glucosamine-1-phosphate N-acetyltransferase